MNKIKYRKTGKQLSFNDFANFYDTKGENERNFMHVPVCLNVFLFFKREKKYQKYNSQFYNSKK